MEKTLTCVFFPDLLPWERDGLLPLVQALGQWGKIDVIDYDPEENQIPRGRQARGPFWIFSHRWERALAALQLPPGTQTYVSVLSPPRPAAFFTALFWKRFRPLSESVRLVAHSPLSFRFLCEISNLPHERVFHLPLPLGTVTREKPKARKEITVAAVARFSSESNLHYFLNVAHYVTHRREGIHFRLHGAGPLQHHLEEMTRELGIESRVSVEEGTTTSLHSVDMLLYLPLQNSHFMPVLKAASLGVPVLACELPGIEDYIQDGKDGYIVPVNDTKPLAELVLRMAADAQFRTGLGQRLQSSLVARLQSDQVIESYAAVLGKTSRLSAAA